MSMRWFGVVVAATAVALAGCTGNGSAPSADASKSPASAGVYTYLTVEFGESWMETKSEMVVMDGAKEIGRSGPLFLTERPVFTTDGRYAFTMPALGDKIIGVSADGGETKSVPCEGCGDRQSDCQCRIVAPIGGSQIAWLDGDNHVVVADLAAESPTPRRTDVTLPTVDGFLDKRVSPKLIAGTDGAAFAAYPSESLSGDAVQPAYLVTLDDPPRRLDPGRPDSIDEAVFSPDGTRVALTGNQEFTCATVTVVDVKSGKGETARVSADQGAKCDNHDVYIDSMWWDRDGTLNVTFDADDKNTAAKGGQSRLEGGRWVESGTGPDTEKRQLSAGTATIQSDRTLSVERDGERIEIDTDVRYLTAAP